MVVVTGHHKHTNVCLNGREEATRAERSCHWAAALYVDDSLRFHYAPC